jgi:ribokinase
MPKIVVVGSLNMDLIVRAPRRPATGETVMGDSFRILPGGKGLNQAAAAARLGADTHMIGRVGDDDFGRRFLTFLDDERVARAAVRVTPGVATGAAVVTLVGGDNAIIVAPGANMWLTPAEAADLPIAAGDICVGQFEVPLESTEAAFKQARLVGALTILNAAPAQVVPAALLDTVDILVINETELAALSGVPISDASADADIVNAARGLARGHRMVVATLGARGVIAVDSAAVHAIAGLPVPVVDPTGAGDCFVGALAAMLAQGVDRPTALARANVAAALSVQRPGAAPSMPTLDELNEALSSAH